jgi:hypothetical protein
LKKLSFEKKRILIAVKTYPVPSVSYGETVCCAGVDIDSLHWIRLYPIPFRDLDGDKKFRKYSIIEAECAKAGDDKRPESFRVRADSIRILDHFDTTDAWERRKTFILRLPIKSMCNLITESQIDETSLGLVKPERLSFEFTRRPKAKEGTREACYAQLGFFNKEKDVIEEIPYLFYYEFFCVGETACPGHKLSIMDWEIGQAYRDWRGRYTDESILLEKIRERWLKNADITRNDVYFYIGNMHRLRSVFLVLGVFYPPLKE